MFLQAEAVCDIERGMAAEDCRTGISFFLRIVPVGAVALKLQIELTFLHFCFLQAKEVRIQGGERLFKSFFTTGSQAVDIP